MRLSTKKKIIGFLFLCIMTIGIIYYRNIKIRAYPIVRKVQHEWILYKTKDYKVRETKNFIIRYGVEDEDVIELIEKAAERDYENVCSMFDYHPKDKTTVIVYTHPEELLKNSYLKQEKPPMGVYIASTIQILSPKLWISEEENMEDIFMNEGPMVHEFTHLIIDDLTKGNYPLWFTEGVALYQEYVQTGYEWGKNESFEGNPYTVKELTNDFLDLDEVLAYKRSFEIVKDVVKENGFDYVNQLINDLGKGQPIEAYSEVFEIEE